MGCSSSTLCASLNLKGELFQTKYLRSVGEFKLEEPEISDLNNVLEGHNYVKIKAFDPPKKNQNSGELMQTSQKTKAGTPERPSSVDVSISFNGAELSHRSILNSPGIKNEAKKLDNSKKSEDKNCLKEMTSMNFGRFFVFKKQVTNSEQKFFEDNFFIEKIGKGGGGEVYKLLHKPSNQFRVVKIVGCIKDPTESRVKKLNKRLTKEANLVANLDHPNIVKAHEILQNETKTAFVMEYVKGEDLFNNLNNPVLQNNQAVANIMEQIFSALSYLHNKGIIHKDIKLQNIMLEEQDPCSIKLIDFGFSEFIDNLNTNKVTGTIGYISPETLQNQQETKSDLWSAGVLLYTFLFKKLPFPGGSYDDIAENIFNLNLDILLQEKQNICSDPLVLQLLKRLLNRYVDQRYSAIEALNDPFIRKYASKYQIESSDIELLRTYQQKSTMELVMSSIFVHHLMPTSERLKFNRVFRALDNTRKGFITYRDLNALDSSIVIEKEILQSTPQGVEITNFIIACVDINNPHTLRTLFVYFDKTNCFRVKTNDVLSSLENHIHKYAAEEIQKCFKSQSEHELCYEEFKKMIKSF